ncbi:glycosyltransferase [Microbacterium sp. BWT-B31]|uniref:glycosyltransferase n=1 Tax=Microbacterium sp. BWT-B31 TaxID=3232072 RepID=UPI003526E562
MTNRPLRVLSLYEGFFAGGARVLHTEVVAGLHGGPDQHHTVLSLASSARRESTVQRMRDDSRYARLQRAGVEVVSLGATAGGAPIAPEAFGRRQLRRAAAALSHADVVLSLKEQPLSLLLALRERGLMPDVPVAVCLHRSDPTHSGPALGWLSESVQSGLVAASISCAESTESAYGRFLHGADRHVVANGVDLERFRPAPSPEQALTRARLGIPERAPVVVFAARFDAMKDPGLFLRAVAEHARRRPGTHYVLCGAGMTPENAGLAAMIADAGIDPAVHLHPLGIREDMPAIYAIADIVSLTSAFGEASPLCLIEGAACGATPVTTDVGDAAAQIAGFGVVTSREPERIAGAWEGVLEVRSHHRGLAEAARPRLSHHRMIDEYRTAVESVARRARLAA